MNHQPTAKFSLIPNNSVSLYAESLGHANLNDEVLSNLSEDVTYRLREAVNNAIRFTRHSKRRCLTTDDFNLALTWSNCQEIYGQNGIDVPNFRSFNFKDSTLSYTEDRDANLRETAFDQTLPADPGEVSIKAQWLVFEGRSCSGGKQSRDEIGSKEVLEEPFATFLEQMISSVFGKNENARKVALETIRTNGKLQCILPYLVTFLVSQVKSCNGNYSLKSIVKGVLFIVHALTENTSLFLIPYVFQLVKLLLFIIIDGKLPVSLWRCKMNAARILTQLCRRHMSTMNYLPHHLLKAYQETVNDDSKPLGSVYGAAFGMSCLGAELTHQLVYPALLKRISGVIETIGASKDLDTLNGSLALLELFQDISLFLLRTAASSPASPTAVKASRPSGGASSTTATTSALKYLLIYNEVSDIFGEVIAFHTQFQLTTGNNLRSVFAPYKTVASKLSHPRNQDTSFGALKKEPQVAENSDISQDFLKARSSLLSETPEKTCIRKNLETTLGDLHCCLKWKNHRTIQKSNVFNRSDEIDATGPAKNKRRRVDDGKKNFPAKNLMAKEQICKLSRKFFKIQRVRLIDLARIPSTIDVVI